MRSNQVQPKETIYITEKLFGAHVYDMWFLGSSVEGVHKVIERFEREEWPQNRRLQSYSVKDM